ncbi:MAG: polysaccharide deacetylase family protein [Planctomycetes bacterium]|nr:polysaccharide deacetylase family protein [Planctomycetota bacterium]
MSPSLVALSAIGLFGLVYVVVPRVALLANRWWLAAECRRRRRIAVTFDDGPGPAMTPLVLERLTAAGVPATFFVLGHNVAGNEALLAQLHRAGHEVGSHGNLHAHHVWSLPWVGVLDTREGWRRLGDVLPSTTRPISFRPPYGKLNLISWWWARRRRAAIAMWTHDSQDTRVGRRCPPAAVAAAVRRSGGGVVLLHDFDRDGAAGTDDVLARLDAVLALRHEGYEFVRVSALLASEPKAASVTAVSAGECR